MTTNQFFKKMLESDLFKDINQSKEVEDFILARTTAFSAIDESDDYWKLEQQKQQYEEEFKIQFEKQEGGDNRFLEYLDIAEETAACSDFLHFEKGFFEGAKFFLVMILFSGVYPDENLYLRNQ